MYSPGFIHIFPKPRFIDYHATGGCIRMIEIFPTVPTKKRVEIRSRAAKRKTGSGAQLNLIRVPHRCYSGEKGREGYVLSLCRDWSVPVTITLRFPATRNIQTENKRIVYKSHGRGGFASSVVGVVKMRG